MLRESHKFDLEELGPKFARHEEPVTASIVDDPVEHIHGNPPVGLREQPAEIDPAVHFAGPGGNPRDPVCQVDVGKDFASDVLQFIELRKRRAAALHVQAPRLPEGPGIDEPQRRGAVAHDQEVPVSSQPPPLTRIAEGSHPLRSGKIVDEPEL